MPSHCLLLGLLPGQQLSNSPGFPGRDLGGKCLGTDLSGQAGRPLYPQLLPTEAAPRAVSVCPQVRGHLKKGLGSGVQVHTPVGEEGEPVAAVL